MNVINDVIPQINSWYEAYCPHLTRMALMLGYQSNDADDLVSQFFLDLIEKNIDAHSIINPQAYLSTAFRRKLVDHHRRSKARMYVVKDDIQEHYNHSEPSAQEAIEQTEYNTELVQQLQKAFLGLPERCKKVIYLKFYEGLNTEQIALKTGLTKRSVYNNLFEGIKLLRGEMGQLSPDISYASMLSFLPLLMINLS